MRILFLLSWLLFGCEEEVPYELWIDNECSPINALIYDKVNEFNLWVSYYTGEELIEIQGKDKVDHEWILSIDGLDPNIGRDFLVCFYQEFASYDTDYPGLVGWGIPKGNIFLFLWKLDDDKEIGIFILHELGHYIGLNHLAAGKVGIMSASLSAGTFTQNDVDELCQHYKCK
jgi:hypothetical protein